MERAHRLTELASLVAMVRAQRRVVRLVLRNTDRFGLIHLYFAQGHLIHVEGHSSSPAASLLDLGTWRQGAIRIDQIDALLPGPSDASELEMALARALAELEARGAIYPAPPARAPRTIQYDGVPAPDTAGVAGLPALEPAMGAAMPQGAAADQIGQLVRNRQGDRLTDPQWQLLAIAVRQVTEHAGQMLGDQIADELLREALAQSAQRNAFLSEIEVDETGWLRAREAGYATRYATFDGAEAIAALLTNFEARCAQLIGAHRARRLIATAVAPLRPSLEQIGIAITAD
jgi:hypothetical protein